MAIMLDMDKTITKSASKEYLSSRGFETRVNKYEGACDCCGFVLAPGAGRIVKIQGGQNWIVLCRTMKCSKGHIAMMRGSVGDSEEGRNGE